MHLSVQGAPCPSSRQRRVIFGQDRDSVPSGTPGKNIKSCNNMVIWERIKCFLSFVFINTFAEEFPDMN